MKGTTIDTDKKLVETDEKTLKIQKSVRAFINEQLEKCITRKDRKKCFNEVVVSFQKEVERIRKEVGLD